MPETSPTARALLALELLQSRPGITAEQLGERLDVTERAARRYVGILREAGIPVESTRGPYGGYRVGRGLRLPPLMFSASEALALVMAVLDGHPDAGDPTDPVGSALGKIVRALPTSITAQAETVRRGAASATDRSAVRPDPETTATLVHASEAGRRVRIGYRTEAGREWSAEVDPWAVVVRHSRWYLLCWSHAVEAQRAFRIDRVRSVALLDFPFTRPADLDPVTALEEHLAAGWEFETSVEIDLPVDQVWLPRVMGRFEPLPDGRTLLTGSTSNPYGYAEDLARLHTTYRILGGPELLAAARDVGKRLLDAAGEG
ncbi:helix-turn-helix transcriptional regulator [Nocardioides sp.]|uniref:helix-turn-helix transcriptional regulator n=1 Tax=Nocardioides sp. TaxID=35761 RepID=UPI002ED06809